MKETNFSIHSDNSSSFDEVGRQANNKTPATMAAITPAKFDNSFWVSILKGLIFNVSYFYESVCSFNTHCLNDLFLE